MLINIEITLPILLYIKKYAMLSEVVEPQELYHLINNMIFPLLFGEKPKQGDIEYHAIIG